MSVTMAVRTQALQIVEAGFMPFVHFGASRRIMTDFSACLAIGDADYLHGLHLASLTEFALNNSEAIDFVRIRGGFARHFLQGFV